MPLISRRVFPPKGWYYYQPQTNWPPIKNAETYFAGKDFDQVVTEIIAHRRANPRHGLSTERSQVEDELDTYTCARLKFDPNYCTGGQRGKAPRPLPAPGSAGEASPRNPVAAVVDKVKKVSQGFAVLLDWVGSGGRTVPQQQAEARASICAKCPKNEAGGIDSYFTQPVAERLHKHLEVKNEMALRTPYDDRIAICGACRCVLTLKVWVPLEHVAKRLKPGMKAELHPDCWILKESQP